MMVNIRRVIEALQENELVGIIEAVEACGGITGVEDVLHPEGEDMEVIVDLLEVYTNLEEEEDLREASRELWGLMFHLGQAGVEARLIAGSCGLCDEFHAWVAAPATQVEALADRVRAGEVYNVDLKALESLFWVEYGPEKVIHRYGNSAGGYEEVTEREIRISLSAREGYSGKYMFLDRVNHGPWQVGGNSSQVRRLIPLKEVE